MRSIVCSIIQLDIKKKKLYLIIPYYKYYSLTLVVLSFNYNILLGTIYPNTSIF
jgi:hypothetical protein